MSFQSTQVKRRINLHSQSLSLYSVSVRQYSSRQNSSKRGEIQAFSSAAQRRFRSLFRRIDFSTFAVSDPYASASQGFLVTVRCDHGDQPTKPVFKRIKDDLARALRMKFGELFGVIWKAERQRTTGTLHLHLVVLFQYSQDRQQLRDWVSVTWGQIIKSVQPDTNTKCLYDNCMRLAVYLAKQPVSKGQTWGHGKCYGQWGVLPFSEPETIEITEDWELEEAIKVLQEMLPESRKIQKLSTRWKGFSLDDLTRQQLADFVAEYRRRIGAVSSW